MEKIVVIGVGFIGGYLRRGMKNLLGSTLRDNVFGVKGSAAGRAERERTLGFDISVNDAAAVLARENPTIIVLSPPPETVPGLTREILSPYYAACRSAGQPLPDLYSFAPSPSADWLAAQLGSDVHCAKILPNIFDTVCGVDITPIGVNSVSLGSSWPEERLAVLRTVLAPYGETVVLTDPDSLVLLAGKITSHVCCEVCCAIADTAARAGVPVTVNALGSAMCAAQLLFCPDLPTLYPCSDAEVPAPLRSFMIELTRAWFDGLHAFTQSIPLSIPAEQAAHIDALSFALNVFPISLETREQLAQDTKNAATKGGVLERGVEYFYEHVEAPLARAVEETLTGAGADSDFFAWIRAQSEGMSRAAYERSLRLAGRDSGDQQIRLDKSDVSD
ncbi:hypothetical protein JQM60_04965 [Butyricicoccus pullicaecorum]|nr:hypothetical protein [Butyricicoccus pullicaecorum]